MNLLGPWIDECCRLDNRACASAKDLYASFSGWCDTNGYGEKTMDRREFGEALAERGFVPYRDRIAGKQARLWRGIGLQQPPDPPPPGEGAGQGDAGSTAGGPPPEDVTGCDTPSQDGPQTTPIKEQTAKPRHNASHVSHPAQPSQGKAPAAPSEGAYEASGACGHEGVTRETRRDADVAISPIEADFIGDGPKGTSQRVTCVTGISREPTTPHPTHPCPRGHHEWMFTRSQGWPAVYGYVCRHPECLPMDRFGCYLPVEACEEEVSP